jgi:hypothetical protein
LAVLESLAGNENQTRENHTKIFNKFYVAWETSRGNEEPKKQLNLTLIFFFLK